MNSHTAELVEAAPSPAWLASKALAHIATEQHDPTSWDTCIGSVIAAAAGFRPQPFDHSYTHTGDTWWVALEALMGDVRLRDGLSLFAPEANPADLCEALERIIAANPERHILCRAAA